LERCKKSSKDYQKKAPWRELRPPPQK